MRRVLLAVDLSYQVYRAAASHPMLTSGDTFTGGLYGFLQSFAKTVRETEATHCVVCCDSKPYRRSLTYPQYKLLRKKNQDDDLLRLYKASEPLVLELLNLAGVPVWVEAGFESDDLVAHASKVYRSRFDRIYAASNDSDLYQLLDNESFAVYRDSIKTVMTRDALMQKHGLTPQQFMLSTALQGTHNDIEGIRGVGEKTAAKAVKDSALMRKYNDSHREIIERNLSLIKLPHPDFPRACSIPTRSKSFSERELYRFCGRFDIDTTLAMVQALEQIDNS